MVNEEMILGLHCHQWVVASSRASGSARRWRSCTIQLRTELLALLA